MTTTHQLIPDDTGHNHALKFFIPKGATQWGKLNNGLVLQRPGAIVQTLQIPLPKFILTWLVSITKTKNLWITLMVIEIGQVTMMEKMPNGGIVSIGGSAIPTLLA